MKSLFKNLLVLLLALLLSAGLGELLVRAIYKDQTVLFPRYHTGYQYGPYRIRGIRPNSDYWMTSVDGSWRYQTNSRGLRSVTDFSYEKAPGTLRVLSLGDSHTQGYEVRQDETFSSVLERYLRARGKTAEVLNAGVSGFSNAESLVFLENEGVKYSPDVAVLGFFGNDFEDNLKAGLFGIGADGDLRAIKYEHLPGVRIQDLIYGVPGVQWLGESSYFYSLLFNAAWEFYKARLAASVRKPVPAGKGSADVTPTEYAVPTVAAVTGDQVALAAALILRMQDLCEEHGIRFLVVDIPVRTGEYSFDTSMPPGLRERLSSAGVEILHSETFLRRFEASVGVHVPNGHLHISPLTHAMIGVELGARVMEGLEGASDSSRFGSSSKD